jgi:hypothetical protein
MGATTCGLSTRAKIAYPRIISHQPSAISHHQPPPPPFCRSSSTAQKTNHEKKKGGGWPAARSARSLPNLVGASSSPCFESIRPRVRRNRRSITARRRPALPLPLSPLGVRIPGRNQAVSIFIARPSRGLTQRVVSSELVCREPRGGGGSGQKRQWDCPGLGQSADEEERPMIAGPSERSRKNQICAPAGPGGHINLLPCNNISGSAFAYGVAITACNHGADRSGRFLEVAGPRAIKTPSLRRGRNEAEIATQVGGRPTRNRRYCWCDLFQHARLRLTWHGPRQ